MQQMQTMQNPNDMEPLTAPPGLGSPNVMPNNFVYPQNSTGMFQSFHHLRRNTSPDIMFAQRQEEIMGYDGYEYVFPKFNPVIKNPDRNGTRKKHPLPYSNSKVISLYSLDLDKVSKGEDVRTTLMIKNIPNKYDQESLLEVINEKFTGLYDFFYLPMDFRNNCNVGYAFINFMNPISIIEFFNDFNDKMWPRFNSVKVCKITYARIQGKDNLIEHFRNSRLMFESPKFRPLVFVSGGAEMGKPETFPFNQTREYIYSVKQPVVQNTNEEN